ncbi:MAG: hypothetical protein KAS15_07730 [Nanoarchaeota archaeon]|nr:hypothetical protein [Nanoarchaeota archaeon]MCK5629307.1 hypothetical protein [Nanoarchaeota archaeon]
MPHQCVHCSKFYDDGSREILEGCSCGGKLFFFIKKERMESLKKAKVFEKLSDKDKEQIEKDVFEIVGSRIEDDQPVILDFEAIRIMKPGHYEIDLVHLFKSEPIIFRLEEGKYIIDLAESFKTYSKK